VFIFSKAKNTKKKRHGKIAPLLGTGINKTAKSRIFAHLTKK
jgi:hypothetical protein